MFSLVEYLLKVSFSLAVVWLFYQLVLRRLTFYHWNRLFLSVYSLLAFVVPLIDVTPILEQNELSHNKLVGFIPPLSEQLISDEQGFGTTLWNLLFFVFVAGVAVLLVKLLIQHLSFLSLRRSAKVLLDAPVKLYQVDKDIIPFSFGRAIFINSNQHSEAELQEILRHEFVHVKQKHSIDMFFSELLCILNWYNPFAWMIRKSIRQNLEFIADDKVVQNGVDKKQYQYLLLKVMGTPQYRIATNFNFTSLKKRIAMMNKTKSAKLHLVKFLFALPLIAVMLLSFRNQVLKDTRFISSIPGEVASDTTPKTITPTKAVLPKKVKSIVAVNNQVTVTLPDGKKESYNFDNPQDKERFEERYGPLPEPPTPPQPVVAAHVTPPALPAHPAPPTPPVAPALPEGVSGMHIHNNQVTVKLKNGTVEKYNLDKPGDKKKFDDKYGDIVPARAPVAPVSPVAPVAPVAPVKVKAVTVTGLETTVTISVAPIVVTKTVTEVKDMHPAEAVVSHPKKI